MRAFDKLGLADAARIHAGTAHADRTRAARDDPEHVGDIVVALGYFLSGLRAGRRIAHQENAHLLGLRFRQGSGEAQPVVAALGAVRLLVENDQHLRHHDAPLKRRSNAASRDAGSWASVNASKVAVIN